jgi:putative FmdB family regulatory protein
MGGHYKMPIYEYECTKCGNISEALQKFSDKPLTRCKHCKGKLTKLVSQSTFHLKGSGWYATDYANKSKNSAKPSKQVKQGKSAETNSSDSGSDSKKTASEKSA